MAPYEINLKPGESTLIWTDIKVYMQEGEELLIFPRSSIGIKKKIKLDNSVGKIDMDYYSNKKNDGNIGICITNHSNTLQTILEGEGVVQGTFYNFLVADNCNSEVIRQGGLGSTNG